MGALFWKRGFNFCLRNTAQWICPWGTQVLSLDQAPAHRGWLWARTTSSRPCQSIVLPWIEATSPSSLLHSLSVSGGRRSGLRRLSYPRGPPWCWVETTLALPVARLQARAHLHRPRFHPQENWGSECDQSVPMERMLCREGLAQNRGSEQGSCFYDLLICLFVIYWFEMGRERNTDILIHLLMHSLVASYMCPDPGLNPKLWHIRMML